MRKKYLFPFIVTVLILILLPTTITVALNYNINFTGSGASASVDSVIVQNLTKGTTLNLKAGNSLNLSDETNAVDQLYTNDEGIVIYPNRVDGKSTLSFYSKLAGNTQISVYSVDGRRKAGISINLKEGRNTFYLSLSKGIYIIQVEGVGYSYSARMISQIDEIDKNKIIYSGNDIIKSKAPQKSKSSSINMIYTAGDRLLFKGISGNYSTIVTDVPIMSKNIEFKFVECKDSEGNNYTTVTIGTQTWMAENLKTTRYNDGTSIPLTTDMTTWSIETSPGYCWYNNDSITYKKIYGALYNYYTVKTGKLAPTGWHVPTDTEWTIMESFLIANGYNYDGTITGSKVAKSMASTNDWQVYSVIGTIGYDLTKNNNSGFSACSAGNRWRDGSFNYKGIGGFWWSLTERSNTSALMRSLIFASSVLLGGEDDNQFGLSVRCIKDTF